MKMKAAVMRAPFEPVTIEEVDVGEPGPREILIKTGASGVCHSDLHYIDGLYKCPLPTILGQRGCGDGGCRRGPGDVPSARRQGHNLPFRVLWHLRQVHPG